MPNLVQWYVVGVNIPNKGWSKPCYEKAKLSQNEIITLFVEIKKILPSSLQLRFENLYKDKKYYYEHEEELNKRAEDRRIRSALKEKLADMTTIIIAQRITSIMDADKIVVMNDGKIMDIGNHEELLARNEVYADLFYTQQKGVSE